MKHGHRVSVIGASLIAMVGIAGCGSEATDPVTDNRTPAQLTVGALLLPPVAEVVGSTVAASQLSEDEFPPGTAAAGQSDELLPPG
jgi:hypothetical protein